ncbi:phosphoribosyl-ATP diphosphatase [Altererythrobacter sp. CAU 1778]
MNTLERLENTIIERRSASPKQSYVAKMNQRGIEKIAQKVGEEATEAVIAAVAGTKKELIGESADLLFHLMMMLEAREVPFEKVLKELEKRENKSGLVEKASRNW